MTDWTTDATDAIERAVTLVRERTVDPVRSVTKAMVYGLLAALLLGAGLLLLVLGVFRVLVVYQRDHAWAAWCELGGIFVLAGGFCWTRRNP